MPRFLKAEDIPMKQRRPHLSRWRSQLRDALTNPALTDEQRAEIKRKLDNLGKPKPYAALAAARQTAMTDVAAEKKPPTIVEPEPVAEEADDASPPQTRDDLLKLYKAELLQLAESEKVPDVKESMTKAEIADAILGYRQSGDEE